MKRSLLLLGLFIPLAYLTAARGFGQVSIGVGIGAPAPAYGYWYYPDDGVYYDYGAHMYFYLDGGNWVRVRHLPPRFHHLHHHVMVHSDRDRPWSHYDDHRAKYPPGHWHEDRHDDGRDHDHGHDHDDHHFDGH